MKLYRLKLYLILLFAFSFRLGSAQNSNIESKISDNTKSNYYRIAITYDQPISLSMQYERVLYKNCTITSKLGPTISIQKFGDVNTTGGSKYQFSFAIFGSIEARYYLQLKKKLKADIKRFNCSGFYLSLEEYVMSNPFLFVNQKKSQSLQGSIQTYLNVGWQQNISKAYFNAYFGLATIKKTLSKYFPDQKLASVHLAITAGISL